MTEQILGGNITLVDFDLESQEMIVIKKIVGNFARKIRNIAEYQELKIVMKTHKKVKNNKYEIKAHLMVNGIIISSEASGFNPFILINETLKKTLIETEHKIRK